MMLNAAYLRRIGKSLELGKVILMIIVTPVWATVGVVRRLFIIARKFS